MSPMTPKDLARATGARIDRAVDHLPHLLKAMAEFEINTPTRQAAFLAQIGHESGGLHWKVELWGPTAAQDRYEGRRDIGNTEPGDGYRFRGRGLIQITGRSNYTQVGRALNIDLLYNPEMLGQSPYAERSAAWFWKSRGLNEIADTGDFRRITKLINGGYNGYDDRVAKWETAKEVLA